MWYDDPEAQQALRNAGMVPVEGEAGRWIADNGMRDVIDFEGGIMMTSRILPDDNRYDVTTIMRGHPRDWKLLVAAYKEHSVEIKRRTEELKERGAKAVEGRGTKS